MTVKTHDIGVKVASLECGSKVAKRKELITELTIQLAEKMRNGKRTSEG